LCKTINNIDFSVQLNNDLVNIIQKFSEHYHDAWAGRKLENGWQYGEQWTDSGKTHPRLKPYSMLAENVSKKLAVLFIMHNIKSAYVTIK